MHHPRESLQGVRALGTAPTASPFWTKCMDTPGFPAATLLPVTKGLTVAP